jgi:ElaB/YqjD/DUF883 family membrane-anchored ribosome-binding protein
MSLLLQSDLQAANNSKAITSLTTDMEDTKKLLAAVENFISGSTSELKGEAYDTVRAHMQVYVEALNSRIKVAENLIAAIKSANGTMTSYMDGEPKLDTSQMETVKNQMNTFKNSADDLYVRYKYYNPEKERISKETIYSLYSEQLRLAKEKEKLYDLLDHLDSTDTATYNKLKAATDDVNTFKTSVGSISSIKV